MDGHPGDSAQRVQKDTSMSADAVSTLGGLSYRAYCEGETRREVVKQDRGGEQSKFY